MAAQDILTTYLNEGKAAVPADQEYRIDDFLAILDACQRFLAVGETFCGDNGANIQAAMRAKSTAFFASYHKARLEDIKAMLEAEQWQAVPLPSTFTITSMKEYAFLKGLATTGATAESVSFLLLSQ
jgi:hypothetical protein